MRIRGKLFFGVFASLFLGGLLWWGMRVYAAYTVIVPARGGEFREALIGSPRYINPVLADTTEAEGVLEALVFSSLFRPDTRGGIEPDLAEDYTVSENRKEYFVTLREGVKWHDGTALTVEDVLFTLSLVTNPLLRSPLAFAWQGVRVDRVSDQTVKFALDEPYEYFLQNLTFRILPQHMWAQVPIENFHLAELNLRPIGSGPYRFRSFERDQLGNITSYTLFSNPEYGHGRPYIDAIRLKFFKTKDEAFLAWKKGEVDAFGGVDAADAATLARSPIRRIATSRQFSVFFNTDSPILSNVKVREALIASVDRGAFVERVLFGGGVAGKGIAYDKERAISLLDGAGWRTTNSEGIRTKGTGRKASTLVLELAVPSGGVHERTAEFLADAWRDIGVDLRISILDTAAISNLMRSRNYDMILLGTLVGPEPDLFPFWHSSQIEYPGANLSRLEYKKLDTLLERARREVSAETRFETTKEAEDLIVKMHAALNLYSPYYFYAVSPRIQFGSAPEIIGAPEERFGRVAEWFIMTARVWKR